MKRKRMQFLFRATIPLLLGLSFLPMSPAHASADGDTWTVMVYMADDFTSTLNWQDDINEMEAAQQAASVNIIALVDPYGAGNSMLLKIAHDPNFLDTTIVSTRIDDGGAVITGGEVNMAAPATLSSFIEFSTANYGAGRYALILWGHGAGWVGLCPDGTDLLTLPELSDALAAATGAIGTRLDMIAVDSCAEASVEMLYQVREYAGIFVASEKDVPFQGLPYVLVMNDLAAAPDQSPEEFGSKIVDDYVAWSRTNSEYSVTMGAFNLSKVDLLVNALNTLSTQGQRYDQIFHDVLKAALNASETYEDAYHVDFGNLMWMLHRSDIPIEMRYLAIECILKLEGVVEHFGKYANPDPTDGIQVYNASGLAIYPPGIDPMDSQYGELSISSTAWYGFGESLRNNTIPIVNGPGPMIYLSSPEPTVDAALVTWPDSYTNVTAWIFRNESGSLAYETVYQASGNQIAIVGTAGAVTIGASATSVTDEAISYRTLNVTLKGTSTVKVRLLSNGESVNTDTKYDVYLVSVDGRTVEGEFSSVDLTGAWYLNLTIPDDAAVGDLVTVQVRERSTDTLVGELKVFVPPVVTTVQIDVVSHSRQNAPIVLALILALLPAVLILAFAWMLYSQSKRRPPK